MGNNEFKIFGVILYQFRAVYEDLSENTVALYTANTNYRSKILKILTIGYI